ncbi:MAG: hypothetical protein QG671_3486 [Actinomycetota bacterium]|nr:hypothetical protein [Actinomycetota bacterium]
MAVLGAVVLVLIWLPPVLEQLRAGQAGNLSHLFSVATGQLPPPADWAQSHSLRESLGAVLRMLPVTITGQDHLPSSVVDLSDQPLPLVRLLASALLLTVAVVVAVLGFRLRRWFVAVTALGTLVCAVTAVVLETQTAGPLLQYAITWAVALPVPTLMVVTGLLPHRTTESRAVAAIGTFAAIVTCALFAVVATIGAPSTANTQPITLLAELKQAQLKEPIELTAAPSVWPVRAAIVNLADKEGYRVLAAGEPPQFPRRLWGDGTGSEVIALPTTGPESAPPTGARLVAQTATYSLWLVDSVNARPAVP